MSRRKKMAPELAVVAQLVPGLAKMFGNKSEVVLHDFSNPKRSLVKIAGNLTGRQVGAPLTDRLLEVYKTYGDAAEDLIGIRTRTRDGRLLSSTTLFIRDKSGRIVGSLGINRDITDLELAYNVLEQELGRGAGSGDVEQPIHFATSIEELMAELIDDTLSRVGTSPQLMSRAERIEVVRQLDKQGFFQIKGGVDALSRRLGVSPYTIYSYLDSVRKSSREVAHGQSDATADTDGTGRSARERD